MSKRPKKDNARLLAVLRNPCALIDEWKCPVCGREFRDQYACEHGWEQVEKANNAFLLAELRKKVNA